MLFGEYIKNLRAEQGLTLEKLSKKCGVNISLLSDYETGKRPPPGPQTIYKLAKTFKIPYIELHKLAIQQEIPDFDVRYYYKKFVRSAFYSEIDSSKLPKQGYQELKTYFDFLLQKYSKIQSQQKKKVYMMKKSK